MYIYTYMYTYAYIYIHMFMCICIYTDKAWQSQVKDHSFKVLWCQALADSLETQSFGYLNQHPEASQWNLFYAALRTIANLSNKDLPATLTEWKGKGGKVSFEDTPPWHSSKFITPTFISNLGGLGRRPQIHLF